MPLIRDRGLAAVGFADVAAALDVREEDVAALFESPREILTENDYFARLVTAFRESSHDLSCSGAWVVAIDELAASMSVEEWTTEAERNALFAREEHNVGGLVTEIIGIIMGLSSAVAERSGAPATSTEVSVFVGTVLGTMLSMPTAFYTDSASWVEAHAVAIDALGPSLDRMLRGAAA